MLPLLRTFTAIAAQLTVERREAMELHGEKENGAASP